MRKLIDERSTGVRTIAGTDFEISNRIERVKISGQRPVWVITYGLCNGIPDSCELFERRKDAMGSWRTT